MFEESVKIFAQRKRIPTDGNVVGPNVLDVDFVYLPYTQLLILQYIQRKTPVLSPQVTLAFNPQSTQVQDHLTPQLSSQR